MRVNQEHWVAFLDFVELHPVLLTNKACARQSTRVLWETIANQLNSLGYGKKTTTEWRKAVTDWKSKVKIKVTKIKAEQAKTDSGGGGDDKCIPLNKIEERLLDVLSRLEINGDGEPELCKVDTLEMQVVDPLNLGFSNNDVDDNIKVEDTLIKIRKRRLSEEKFTIETLEISSPNIEHQDHLYANTVPLTPTSESKRKKFKSTKTQTNDTDPSGLYHKEMLSLLKNMNNNLSNLNNIDKSLERLTNNVSQLTQAVLCIAKHLNK